MTPADLIAALKEDAPVFGTLRFRTSNLGGPKLRPATLAIVLRLPPIISSAMLFELSCAGSQTPTTRPPRRIVAAPHNSLISCNLWLM